MNADWIGITGNIASLMGVIVALLALRSEIRNASRERADEYVQRKQDLKWRQAEMAKSIVDEMLTDSDVDTILSAIDYPESKVKMDGGPERIITKEEIQKALSKTPDLEYTETDKTICRLFDSFFWYLGALEHYVATELVQFDDIKFPADYYLTVLGQDQVTKNAVLKYLQQYRLQRTLAFIKRIWN